MGQACTGDSFSEDEFRVVKTSSSSSYFRPSSPASTDQIRPDAGEDALSMLEPLNALRGLLGCKHSVMAEDGVQTLNVIVRVLWPRIAKAITKQVLPEITRKARTMLSFYDEIDVHDFEIDLNLGSVPPHIRKARLLDVADYIGSGMVKPPKAEKISAEKISMQLEISWKSGKDFLLKPKLKAKGIGGISITADNIAVNRFSLDGVVSVILAPLIEDVPFFSSAQVFFLDMPFVQLELTHGANFQVPWIITMMRRVLEKMATSILADNFVLPNRLLVKNRVDIPMEKCVLFKSPWPVGYLEFEVVSATGLPVMDTFTRKCDPYVTIQVGNTVYRSSTVLRKTSPIWKDGTNYLPIACLSQVVKICVWDDELVNNDGIIGWVKGFTVGLLCGASQGEDGAVLPIVRPNHRNSSGSATGLGTKACGALRVKARFLQVEDLAEDPMEYLNMVGKSRKAKCPTIVALKLHGLEGSRSAQMEHSQISVQFSMKAQESNHNKTNMSNLMPLGNAISAVERVQLMMRVKGHPMKAGIQSTAISAKAFPWRSPLMHKLSANQQVQQVSRDSLQAIHQLHDVEGWGFERIASVFGYDVELVKRILSIRTNLEVAWHQAFYFLVPPGEDPQNAQFDLVLRMQDRIKRRANKDTGKDGAEVFAEGDGHIAKTRIEVLADCNEYDDSSWNRKGRVNLTDDTCTPEDVVKGSFSKNKTFACEKGLVLEYSIETRTTCPKDVAACVAADAWAHDENTRLEALSRPVHKVDIVKRIQSETETRFEKVTL